MIEGRGEVKEGPAQACVSNVHLDLVVRAVLTCPESSVDLNQAHRVGQGSLEGQHM